MNTSIKNTLFRFATHRAPELSQEEGLDKRFIFRNTEGIDPINLPFDNAVADPNRTMSKWQAMAEVAFTDKLTKDEVKGVNKSLWDLAVWIARNKHSFTTQELVQKISAVQTPINDTIILNKLWNNLFDQTIHLSDFYLKEAIMQLLVANHVVNNKSFLTAELDAVQAKKPLTSANAYDLEKVKTLINARIVLPQFLFGQESNEVESSNVTSKQNKTAFNAKKMAVAQAHLQLQACESLADITRNEAVKSKQLNDYNFKKAEDYFLTNNRESIETDKRNLEGYIQKKELLQNRIEYLTQLSLNDPEKFALNTSLSSELKELNGQLLNLTAPIPTTPAFIFTPRPEIDGTGLLSKLNDKQKGVLSKILNTEEVVQSLSSSTFQELFTKIERYADALHQTILDNSTFKNTQFTAFNGIIIPTGKTTTFSSDTKTISLKTQYVSQDNWCVLLTFDDPTTVIVNADYNLAYLNDVISSNTVQSIGPGMYTLFGSIPHLSGLNGLQNPAINLVLNGIIELDDQQLYTVNSTLSLDRKQTGLTDDEGFIYTTTAQLEWLKPVDDSNNNGTPDGNNSNSEGDDLSSNRPLTFVPSGFGVKQLGITDYKKVEQSVQGYVEGEVAHVENVMAREYKEKSSRKLTRSETTTTTSSETEREQLNDSTSTSRFEMQTEIASVLSESRDLHAESNFNSSWGGNSGYPKYNLGISAGIASNSSREESNRLAQTQAQEITQRAMERIVNKVKQERINKIVEEYEENNKHGFDNTKGDKHVVGVYRWIDKIYKNRIVNYGKRLMFEFMIPEPARLHVLGLQENQDQIGVQIQPPVDPRQFKDVDDLITKLYRLEKYTDLTPKNMAFWLSKYNSDADNVSFTKKITHNFNNEESKTRWDSSFSKSFEIPEGYSVKSIQGSVSYAPAGDSDSQIHYNINRNHHGRFMIGGKKYLFKNVTNPLIAPQETTDNARNGYLEINVTDLDIQEQIGFSMTTWDMGSYAVELTLECEANDAFKKQLFKTIIDAYEDAVVEYNQKLAEQMQKGAQMKESNPGYYRQFENMILRKNCISYLIDQDQNGKRTYGKNMAKKITDSNGNTVNPTFGNYEIEVNSSLNDYTAFAKFMEQAFEWDIMSYNFYPYYWGNRDHWAALYQYECNDPLFKSFMQAGMARVIVTVRPGFEDAVRFYMQTGQIWNGGEVPVIEDATYLSIVDELREPSGKPEGKAWWTRIPTALTILQAQTIGLVVNKALPFDTEVSDFEDPTTVPQSEGLEFSEAELGVTKTARLVGRIIGNENKEAKIVLKKMDNTVKELTYCDANGNWELNDIAVGKYQLELDANNDFPNTTYHVTVGAKNQLVELSSDQVIEINLTIAPLT